MLVVCLECLLKELQRGGFQAFWPLTQIIINTSSPLTSHIHVPLLACMFFFLFAYGYLADFVWCRCSYLLFLYSLTSMHTPWCNMETEWNLELSGQWWTCADGKKRAKRQAGWRKEGHRKFISEMVSEVALYWLIFPGLQPTLCPRALFSQTWVSAVIAIQWPFSDCLP